MGKFRQLSDMLAKKLDMATDDNLLRRRILFYFMSAVLSLTSFVMAIINVITGEYLLMTSTLIFGLLCMLNVHLMQKFKKNQTAIYIVFGVEMTALLLFFLISGIPSGFSVLWSALVPSFALMIFGKQKGCIFSAVILAVLLFFFWTPIGRGLLQYEYTDVFMLRFPFFFGCSWLLSLVIEELRATTQKRLEKAKHDYDYLYRHDALTGICNRYGMEEFLSDNFGGTLRNVSVIMYDVDNFKRINDSYGHGAGDAVLKMVATAPRRFESDSCGLFRFGGEEFLLIMRGEHDALKMAEEIRRDIEGRPVVHGKNSISVTVSLGVCRTENPRKSDIERMIVLADKAMYAAKANGKNRVECEDA